jgi:hypothetical protein
MNKPKQRKANQLLSPEELARQNEMARQQMIEDISKLDVIVMPSSRDPMQRMVPASGPQITPQMWRDMASQMAPQQDATMYAPAAMSAPYVAPEDYAAYSQRLNYPILPPAQYGPAPQDATMVAPPLMPASMPSNYNPSDTSANSGNNVRQYFSLPPKRNRDFQYFSK